MILTVKDDVVKALMERHQIGSLAGAVAYINKIIDRASREDLDSSLFLRPEVTDKLREIFGGFTDDKDLLARIQRLGQVKVQGREYTLNSGQIARIKQEAFGHAKNGEPRSENLATKEQAEKIVQRYLQEQLDYFMRMMCSQL